MLFLWSGRSPTSARLRSVPVGVVFGVGVAAVFACSSKSGDQEDDNQFRDDVIWCEEAAARLEECCPGFDATQIQCRFHFKHDTGCGPPTTTTARPAYALEESKCVQRSSCDALIASGACTRGAEAGALRMTVVTEDDAGVPTTIESPPREPVCK